VARTHQPTPTSLRMRIAEKRVVQHRVAAKLDISDAHLSHLLTERKSADAATLIRIADAIEAVISEAGAAQAAGASA
jgi:transcriptional regulator with XRE-family HTH domain